MGQDLPFFLNLTRKQLYRRLHALARPLEELPDKLVDRRRSAVDDSDTLPDINGSAQICSTDGCFIYWNRSLLEKTAASSPDTKKAEALLLHQIIHCLFGHPFSSVYSCHPGSFRLACDISAWYIAGVWIPELLPDGMEDSLKQLASCFPDISLYHAGELAAALEQEKGPSLPELSFLTEQFSLDSHELWPILHPAASALKLSPKADGEGKGSGGVSGPLHGNNRNSAKSRWKKQQNLLTIKGAPLSPEKNPVQAGGSMGSISRRWHRALTLTDTRRHDYRSLLKSLACWGEEMKLNSSDFQYAPYLYGLEHLDGIPLMEPLEYEETARIRELCIVIDTSASCSGSLTQAFLEETRNLILENDLFFHPFNLHILQCDLAVERDDKLTSMEDLEYYIETLEIHGMGGTDFCPAFEHIKKLQACGEFTDLPAILFFTDGAGIYPSEYPGVRTIFLFLRRHYDNIDVPPWAETLVLDEPAEDIVTERKLL